MLQVHVENIMIWICHYVLVCNYVITHTQNTALIISTSKWDQRLCSK